MAEDRASFTRIDISVTAEPSAAKLEAVKAGLVAYNERVAGADTAVPLAVFAERHGALIGGATGSTQWGWLFIEYLWVSEEVRGVGLGLQLLQRAECAARKRGCGAVWLDTFSFQALGFYERLGYRQFGQLDEYPPGSARHFLWKPLVNHTAPRARHSRNDL